jgi:VTC domain
MQSAAQPNVFPSGRTVASLEREIKFLVPAARSVSLRAWLASVCRPDRAYPPALVCTTYYDTPGLSLLGEKIDSDYLKTKVRVRWYAALDGNPAGSPVFAEVKYRVGNRRDKLRIKIDADPIAVSASPLHGPAWKMLLDRLRLEAPMVPARLEPILSLRYARHRYLDPATTGRLTVDEDIVVTALNQTRLAGRVPARVSIGVFEYKGPQDDLPRHLTPVIRFGARRGSCSKYLACYQTATGLLI